MASNKNHKRKITYENSTDACLKHLLKALYKSSISDKLGGNKKYTYGKEMGDIKTEIIIVPDPH